MQWFVAKRIVDVSDGVKVPDLAESEGPNSPKRISEHLQDFGGKAVDEVGTKVVFQVLESVFVSAPKQAAETIACAVVDGLGSF